MAQRDLYQHDAIPRKIVTGLIANSPGSAGAALYVTIPTFPDPTRRWGPCTWDPHQDSLPTAGGLCLVAFDENDIPWCIQWVGPWTDAD